MNKLKRTISRFNSILREHRSHDPKGVLAFNEFLEEDIEILSLISKLSSF